ncbi:MAG: hypothetical protein LW832_03080, partial [Parachlamydia sp.]|nr:hypothetical protein [Parachlamydia sp.]
FHRHLLRPSSLLDLANLSKFAAISAMYWDIKSRRQKFKNLPARGIIKIQSDTKDALAVRRLFLN